MRDGRTLERYRDKALLRLIGGLPDCIGNVIRLAEAIADAAIAVADDDERREGESLSALYDFCNTIELYELLDCPILVVIS